MASFLAANNFDEVYNIEGGIDAYSRKVDSTVPQY